MINFTCNTTGEAITDTSKAFIVITEVKTVTIESAAERLATEIMGRRPQNGSSIPSYTVVPWNDLVAHQPRALHFKDAEALSKSVFTWAGDIADPVRRAAVETKSTVAAAGLGSRITEMPQAGEVMDEARSGNKAS